ncbi:MAG: SelB C-terminal domain-containing protein, partial [Halieaceae bacterium]
VALCISGKVELNDIDRGDLLVDPDFCDMSERIDVSLKLLPGRDRPLKHLTPVKVHIGAKRLAAQLALINNPTSKLSPGESSTAQLILQEALCATHGERFVIRDDSEMETLGGGYVLDPIGPKYGKSKTERLQWLDALEHADIAVAANALIQQDHCVDVEKLTTCFNLKGVIPSTLTPEDCISFQAIGKRWITKKSNLAKTRKSLVDAVQHSEGVGNAPTSDTTIHQPAIISADKGHKQPGIIKDKLLAIAGRSTHPALAEATLAILLKQGELANSEGRIRLSVSLDAPNPHDALWQSLEHSLQAADLNVPVISEARSQARLSDLDIKIAIKQGRERGLLHRVNAERFVLTQTLIKFAEAAEKTVESEPLSVVAFKNQLGIGRKLAIEILEYFDGIGFTRRSGDQRTIVNKGVIEKRFVT